MDIPALIDDLERIHGRARHLPRFDPMDELVSCILSQHTADANSFPAFTRLKETFNDWQDVVNAGPERLADVIREAGLANQKARNIIKTLQTIHDRTGAFSLEELRNMPTEEANDWLLELPGVGPKTAAIVLCFAMGRNKIPVDTHVYRVSWRLGLVPEGLGETKTQTVLEQIVPPTLSFRFHTALIQHGRTICRAPTPLCERCPLTAQCWWYQTGSKRPKPAKVKKPAPRARKTGKLAG